MSLATWRAEFYPITAKQAVERKEDLVAHSLQKWRGLTKANLKKHNVRQGTGSDRSKLLDNDNLSSFWVSDETCALCEGFQPRDDCSPRCGACPLLKVRRGVACDNYCGRETRSPYTKFTLEGDPRPMIKWLERAAKA